MNRKPHWSDSCVAGELSVHDTLKICVSINGMRKVLILKRLLPLPQAASVRKVPFLEFSP